MFYILRFFNLLNQIKCTKFHNYNKRNMRFSFKCKFVALSRNNRIPCTSKSHKLLFCLPFLPIQLLWLKSFWNFFKTITTALFLYEMIAIMLEWRNEKRATTDIFPRFELMGSEKLSKNKIEFQQNCPMLFLKRPIYCAPFREYIFTRLIFTMAFVRSYSLPRPVFCNLYPQSFLVAWINFFLR